MRWDKAGTPKGTVRKTAQGRRVTSKTFTILGASTPDLRISTAGAWGKQKLMALAPFHLGMIEFGNTASP